jgi:hypothetical protein
MKRFLVVVVLCLLFGGLNLEQANAGTHFVSGDACQESVGSERDYIDRDSNGVHNNSATARWVWCPIMGIIDPNGVDIIDAEVFYNDVSSTTQVKCELWIRTETGTGYFSGFRYSQPAHSPPWTTTSGANLSDTGRDFIFWTNPLNSGSEILNTAAISYKCLLNQDDNVVGYWVSI